MRVCVEEGHAHGAILNGNKTVILLGSCGGNYRAACARVEILTILGVEQATSNIFIHPDDVR